MPLFDALFGSPVRPRFGAILSAVLGCRISGTACREMASLCLCKGNDWNVIRYRVERQKGTD
jgi:hypothetical protein